MEIKKLILTENDCYQRGRKLVPKGIIVHSTGANNPTLKRYVGPDDGIIGINTYNNHWNMSDAESLEKFGQKLARCVHAFIGLDKNSVIRTYQTLPWDMQCWGCAGTGNQTHIQFEVCEDGLQDRQYFYAAVMGAATDLCAYLCYTYDLPVSAITDHAGAHQMGIASGHADISHWLKVYGLKMDDFRKEVGRKLDMITKQQFETMYDEMNPLIKDINDTKLPASLKPEVQKLLDSGAINGGTDRAVNARDINMRLDSLKAVVVAKR